jgi:hypothetical protein
MSISAHFSQYLQEGGIGTRNTDIFLYQLPLGEKYVPDITVLAVIPVGGQTENKGICVQDFELLVRACNGEWTKGEALLERIVLLIKGCGFCQLGLVVADCCGVNSTHSYKLVGSKVTDAPSSLGADSEGNMLFSMRLTIYYDKNTTP